MIIVPDIHGRSFWRDVVKEHKGEKIIFLGDYTDPYSQEGLFQWNGYLSLAEVLDFKKENADSVILLLGNHDLSYVDSVFPKCRHDYENHVEIKELLLSNLSLFNVAHEQEIAGKRFVFSHAGILHKWLKNNEITFGQIPLGEEVKMLNRVFHEGHAYAPYADVSFYRGGDNEAGSCVWADVEEHFECQAVPLPGCYQVFGHTQMNAPIITDRFACLDCRKVFMLDEKGEFQAI